MGNKLNRKRLERLHEILDSGMYFVDAENGEVRNRHGRVLRGAIGKRGYPELKLCRPVDKSYSYYVHEVVAVVGGLNILNQTVNHIDGDKLNNRLSNLEAIPQIENNEHYHKILKKERILHQQFRIESHLIIDGQTLTEDEMKSVIALIRTLRD